MRGGGGGVCSCDVSARFRNVCVPVCSVVSSVAEQKAFIRIRSTLLFSIYVDPDPSPKFWTKHKKLIKK